MGLLDILNAGKIKKENDNLKELLTPEMEDAANLKGYVDSLEDKRNKLEKEVSDLSSKLSILKSNTIFFEDALIFQEYGLYSPRYNFMKAEEYKLQLERIRTNQKEMIKKDNAILADNSWTVNGSAAQGRKMVKDMKTLFLRAFNSDCEDTISKVKYSNFDMSVKKIRKSAESIERLGKVISLHINTSYINSKIDELHLAFEYQLKKQQEKEEQKEIREQMRAQAKLQKEIEEARKTIQKEQEHYTNALSKINKQLESASDMDKELLLEKKHEIEHQLSEIDKNLKDIDYRESNHKAGYVYIISNIGSFGENVYKIGMTRRLEPLDRVDELGDASVPFDFDVHAMIFSDDAPKLEAALHKAFEDKKVNMVNHRREFFRVSLEDIKAVIKANYDKTIEFVDVPDADQWRITQSILESKK